MCSTVIYIYIVICLFFCPVVPKSYQTVTPWTKVRTEPWHLCTHLSFWYETTSEHKLSRFVNRLIIGLGDISNAIVMRISSVKPVPWLALNLHYLFSNGAAFNTQSRSSQISYAIFTFIIADESPSIMNAILRRLSAMQNCLAPCRSMRSHTKICKQLGFIVIIVGRLILIVGRMFNGIYKTIRYRPSLKSRIE